MKPIDDACAPGTFPASHHFPTMDNCSAVPSDEPAVKGDQFRPLFQSASVSSDQAKESNNRSDTENNEEVARKKGYQLGFDAGRQDACQMANNILSPQFNAFHAALSRLIAYQNRIADQASTQIIQLALATAECILGTKAEATLDDLQDLRKPLMGAIHQQHQLALSYHPQDLAIIRQLMECHDGTQWKSSDGLVVSEDDSNHSGSMTLQYQGEGHILFNDLIATTLNEMLTENKKS